MGPYAGAPLCSGLILEIPAFRNETGTVLMFFLLVCLYKSTYHFDVLKLNSFRAPSGETSQKYNIAHSSAVSIVKSCDLGLVCLFGYVMAGPSLWTTLGFPEGL